MAHKYVHQISKASTKSKDDGVGKTWWVLFGEDQARINHIRTKFHFPKCSSCHRTHPSLNVSWGSMSTRRKAKRSKMYY